MANGPLIPSFQAQRPEAVHANVVQLGGSPRVSFWGTVVPSLAQGASLIQRMVEGNPEVEFQERNLNERMNTQFNQDYEASDNPQLRAQMLRERAAYLRQQGREEEAKLIEARDPSLMNAKQQMDRKAVGALEGYQQTAAGYVEGQRRGSPAPGAQQPPAAGAEAEGGPFVESGADFMPAHLPTQGEEPYAGTVESGADFMPPQLEMPRAQEGSHTQPDHPLLQQVSASLAQRGMDVPVHMLHANGQNGVVASLQAAAEGRMPWNPTAFFPPPAAHTPEQGQALQAAQQLGMQTAPQLGDVVRSGSNLRVIMAVRAGKEPDATDLFGMTVDDTMAGQIVNEAMYKVGATATQWDPVKLAGLAQLMSDPDNAAALVAGDQSGFYQSIQDAYLQSSPSEQAVVNGVAQKLGYNAQLRAAMGDKVEIAKMQAAQRAAQTELMAKHYRTQEQQGWVRLQQTSEKNQQDAQFREATLGLQREGLENQKRGTSSNIARNDALTDKDRQAVHEKKVTDYLKSQGLSENSDSEIKNSDRVMRSYDQSISRQRNYAAKLENALARYRKGDKGGLAEAMAELKGKTGEKAEPQRPGWEQVAQTRIEQELEATRKRLTDEQKKYNDASNETTRLSELARKGAPAPGTFVRQYFNQSGDRPPSPEFVQTIKGLYRNSDDEYNKPEYTGDETADLKTYVGKWGPQWKKLTPQEQQLLQAAFRQYHKAYRGK